MARTEVAMQLAIPVHLRGGQRPLYELECDAVDIGARRASAVRYAEAGDERHRRHAFEALAFHFLKTIGFVVDHPVETLSPNGEHADRANALHLFASLETHRLLDRAKERAWREIPPGGAPRHVLGACTHLRRGERKRHVPHSITIRSGFPLRCVVRKMQLSRPFTRGFTPASRSSLISFSASGLRH